MTQLTLHNLKINPGAKKKARRVGRGNASGRGTYSGRGLKGQRSRSGGKKGLKRRGLKYILKSKPKIGGFKSLKPKLAIVNLKQLEKNFSSDQLVNLKILQAKKLIDHQATKVKILGNGKLTKKLKISAQAFSQSAKKAIIAAGGQIQQVNLGRVKIKSR
jgi:large subunit ribosomal protein L15